MFFCIIINNNILHHYENGLQHLGSIVNYILSPNIKSSWESFFQGKENVRYTMLYYIAKRSLRNIYNAVFYFFICGFPTNLQMPTECGKDFCKFFKEEVIGTKGNTKYR